MKKFIFVIAEYNPFHKGHKYHIEKTKKEIDCNNLIIILSGNFVQRGEPAILNQDIRAKMAVKNGADLVIKLPTLYSTASSDFFTFGAIKIIKELNVSGYLSFGSETGELNKLVEVGRYLAKYENEYFQQIRKFLKNGISVPEAREKFINKVFGSEHLLKGSNNLLGIDYIKNIYKFNIENKVKPFTVKREGKDYNDTSYGDIMSATGIRNILKSDGKNWEKSVPKNIRSLFNTKYRKVESIFPFLKKIIIREGTSIKKYRGIVEGLENLLYNSVNKTNSYDDLIDELLTKRYTKSFLKRSLLSIFLNIKKESFNYLNKRRYPFLEIIDFNKKGQNIIKKLTKNSSIPLIHNVKKYPWKNYYTVDKTLNLMRDLEIRTNQLYDLL